MEHKIRSDTSVFKDGRIVLEIFEVDPIMKLEQRILRQVIETQDQHVRESLIKLGWTPPERGI